MSRRVYKNPPIVEAICEVLFEPLPTWNPKRVGALYDCLSGVLDGKPEQDVVMAPAEDGVHEPHIRSKFSSADGKKVAFIGQGVVSAHSLKPYIGWEEDFYPFVEEVLGAFWKVTEPVRIVKVTVRYINLIVLPSTHQVNRFIRILPTVPEGFPELVVQMRNSLQLLDEGRDAIVTVNTKNQPSRAGTVGFMLDILASRDLNPAETELNSVLDTIRTLRKVEREVFELCITDDLRQIFDEPASTDPGE